MIAIEDGQKDGRRDLALGDELRQISVKYRSSIGELEGIEVLARCINRDIPYIHRMEMQTKGPANSGELDSEAAAKTSYLNYRTILSIRRIFQDEFEDIALIIVRGPGKTIN